MENSVLLGSNHWTNIRSLSLFTQAVVRRCSVEKVFLEILQISEENTCARVSFFNRDSGTGVFL